MRHLPGEFISQLSTRCAPLPDVCRRILSASRAQARYAGSHEAQPSFGENTWADRCADVDAAPYL